MLKVNKRKSIFYILIIRIFIFVFIISIIQTVYLIQKEIAIKNKEMEEQSQIITNEIESILELIRSNLNDVDKY